MSHGPVDPGAWWDKSAREMEPHEELFPYIDALARSDGRLARSDANDGLCLYYGTERHNLDSSLQYSAPIGLDRRDAGENVIQWCTDSKVALLVNDKLHVFPVTERGSEELKRKAKSLECAIEAQFNEWGINSALENDIIYDGCLFGAGRLKITPDLDNMRVLCERVLPGQILCRPADAKLKKPRELYYCDSIAKSVLLAQYGYLGDHVKTAIEEARSEPDMFTKSPSDMVSDRIPIFEAWHLPSGRVDKDKDSAWLDGEGEDSCPHDGRHVVVIQGVTLIDEPWPHDYFPVPSFVPMPHRYGIGGMGIPELLAADQLAINDMNARINGIINLHARPLIYVWRRSGISPSKINNSWANILEGNVPAGQALQHIVPNSVPSDYLQRLRDRVAVAEKKAGLNEMSISAAKPMGIDHAPGMQYLKDTETVRHGVAHEARERFHLELANMLVDAWRFLARHAPPGKSIDIIWGNSKELKRLKWEDMDLEKDKYQLRMWMANLLPKTPSAKISRAVDMANSGLISPAEARKMLLDHPDLDSISADSEAEIDNIERRLDRLAAGDGSDSDNMLHPYMNLPEALARAKRRINRMEADGDDPAKIEGIIQFFEDATIETQKLQAQEAAAQQPPQGLPPAVPSMGPGPQNGM